MTGRGTPVPSLVMDRPVLHSLVDRLRADERLPAFAAALPTRARASAAALAERMPPPAARPAPLRVAPGEEPGIELLAESLALAGYERVERVEERGQFAVRGGLVDVFPTTGREPLRIELFGDEIEQIRAFSPFTQRALRQIESATIFPAAERRRDLVDVELPDEDAPIKV